MKYRKKDQTETKQGAAAAAGKAGLAGQTVKARNQTGVACDENPICHTEEKFHWL